MKKQFFRSGLIGLLFFLVLFSCDKKEPPEKAVAGFEALSGPYFGQEPQQETAQLFMPGLISTYGRNGNISFLDNGKFCVFTTDETGTQFTYLDGDHWTAPQKVPWGYVQGINDYTLGGDGRTFYWQSNRFTGPNDKEKDVNIWKSERVGLEWTEPVPLPDIVNHPRFNEIYPTATADGTVYYFCSNRPDSQGADIYYNRIKEGEYSATERIPWPVNSGYGEFDFIVAPDESYLIFASNRPGGFGLLDNYISFRQDDGKWTHPCNMGKRINSYGNEFRSSVTHDNMYFFFGSTREAVVPKGDKFVAELAEKYGDNDVYWIDTSIISELKTMMFTKQCAADIIRKELYARGFLSALDLLKKLHASQQDKYCFSLFELLDLCERLIKENKEKDSEILYTALLERFDRFRIQRGYAVILAARGYLDRGISLLQDLADAGYDMDFKTSLVFLYYDLKDQKKIQEAIHVLKYKIERFPDSYFSYCYLAAMYETQGDIDKAIDMCERAIELQPDYSDATEILKRLKE